MSRESSERPVRDWRLEVASGNSAALRRPSDRPGDLGVDIHHLDAESPWQVQLNAWGLSVTEGHRYSVRFTARATRPRKVSVGVSRGEEPWTTLGLYCDIDLTTEWRSVEESFVASASTSEARLHFDLAADEADLEVRDVVVARGRDGILKSYVVCASPRSGSNLLCLGLNKTWRAGRPQEYFLYWWAERDEPESMSEIARQWAAKPVDQYLSDVLEAGSSPNGIFGVKLMWVYLDLVLDRLGRLPGLEGVEPADVLGEVFPHLTYLHVVRRDRFRQAVSLTKAIQSGRWADSAEGEAPRRGVHRHEVDYVPRPQSEELTYDFDQIAHFYRVIEHQERAWQNFFCEAGVEPYVVVYEDLIAERKKTLLGVLEHLGVAAPNSHEQIAGDLRIRQQSDGVNEDWASRFRDEWTGRFGSDDG